MSNLIETIEYKGFEIEICYDTDPQSPDHWDNDDLFLVYDHRQFSVKRDGFNPYKIYEHYQETKKLFYDGYYVFPLYAYIHSGVSLSLGRSGYPFTDRWDVSSTGFILVKRMKGWTWKKKQALKAAESLVEEWNQYLSGEVYGFDWEHGRCWGFYGDMEYCISQARDEVDGYIEHENKARIKAHLTQLRTWIINRVPFAYRKPLELINS